MLGFRVLLGLEPKGNVLTCASDPILPFWMQNLTLSGIPGRWGRVDISAQQKGKIFAAGDIYEGILIARMGLDDEEAAA
jgi:hypothetical protein